MPPMAGLQDICAIRSAFIVIIAVLQTEAGAGARGFAAGMPAANDHNFVDHSGTIVDIQRTDRYLVTACGWLRSSKSNGGKAARRYI